MAHQPTAHHSLASFARPAVLSKKPVKALPFCLFLLLLTACIVQAPTSEGTKIERPKRPPAPPLELKIAANFGDAVELTTLGVSPGSATPGEGLKIAANFEVKAALDADYVLFVHVEDADGRVDRLNLDHTPVRGSRPTSSWKPGETIRDEFEIPVPPGMNVRGLNVLLGFWNPRSDQRLSIKNADAVKTDGRDRLLVASIPVNPAS